MSYIKNNLKINSCQEKNNNFENIYETNKEFLNDCTEFVININNLKDSPWKNDGIVRWATSDQKISLSNGQRKILQFLQYRYFRKNQPCFVKQSYIAKELEIHRSQVNRTLKSLEDKNLIIRVQWLYKGRRKNTILLPLIPSLKQIFSNKNLPTADFQNRHIKCNILFCKPLKSEHFSKAYILYTNILYINMLFNNNLVNLNTIIVRKLKVPSEQSRFVSKTIFSAEPKLLDLKKDASKIKEPLDKEKEDETMLNKFLLKRKKQINNHPQKETFDLLKTKFDYDFDKLSIPQQNKLNEYIAFFHSINIKTHFKISDKKNDFYTNTAKEIRKRFIKLISNGYDLQWTFADKVIEYWNNNDIHDKNYQRINLKNKETKVYINSVIAISYCLIYETSSNPDKIFEAIDRLKLSHYYNKFPFNYRKNIVTIINFFTYKNDRSSIKNFLASKIEFERWLFQIKVLSRHKERVDFAYKQFHKAYIDQFYYNNKDKGNEVCYHYEFLIKRFLEQRICEIVDTRKIEGKERILHHYSLVEERFDGNTMLPSLLQRYFFYLYKKPSDGGFLLSTICRNETWDEFINRHMRDEVGLNDFYKLKEINK